MVLFTDPIVGTKEDGTPKVGQWTWELQSNDLKKDQQVVWSLCVMEGWPWPSALVGQASTPYKKHLVSKHPEALHNIGDMLVSAVWGGVHGYRAGFRPGGGVKRAGRSGLCRLQQRWLW